MTDPVASTDIAALREVATSEALTYEKLRDRLYGRSYWPDNVHRSAVLAHLWPLIAPVVAELSAAQAENEALRKAPPDPITDFDRASGVDHWIGRASYWYERTQEEVRLGAMQRLSIAELTADLAAAHSTLSRVQKLADEWDGHWAERGVPNPYAARIRAALNSEASADE